MVLFPLFVLAGNKRTAKSISPFGKKERFTKLT